MPRNPPKGAEVRRQHEVAVPAFPRSELVAVDGVHVDVDGEQVVARLAAVREHLVEEVTSVQALALESSLHVGEADEDGVDVASLDLGA